MLGAVALAGCAGRGEERVARRDAGVSSTQSPAQARVDRVRQLATAAVHAGCAPSSNRQSVPLAPSGPRTYDYDVVFYTAHPDDESMYAGGTLARLARAHRRVALVVLSHGEGGRLLVPGSRGELVEVRDRPRADVVRVRDAEMARAAQIGHAELSYLNPAEANTDYEFTTSCGDALAHWDRSLPGGVAGIVDKMIRDIRNRRPRPRGATAEATRWSAHLMIGRLRRGAPPG